MLPLGITKNYQIECIIYKTQSHFGPGWNHWEQIGKLYGEVSIRFRKLGMTRLSHLVAMVDKPDDLLSEFGLRFETGYISQSEVNKTWADIKKMKKVQQSMPVLKNDGAHLGYKAAYHRLEQSILKSYYVDASFYDEDYDDNKDLGYATDYYRFGNGAEIKAFEIDPLVTAEWALSCTIFICCCGLWLLFGIFCGHLLPQCVQNTSTQIIKDASHIESRTDMVDH